MISLYPMGYAPIGNLSDAGEDSLSASDLAAIDTLIVARLGDIAAAVLAAAQVTPIQSTSQDRILEGTMTEAEALRILLAGVAGKRVGLGTTTEEYMAQDGTTPRITFTPSDAAGNGTTVVDGS